MNVLDIIFVLSLVVCYFLFNFFANWCERQIYKNQ